jgi:hypothetical protein
MEICRRDGGRCSVTRRPAAGRCGTGRGMNRERTRAARLQLPEQGVCIRKLSGTAWNPGPIPPSVGPALKGLSVNRPWPLVSLLPIAANSWSGQVLSRSSSRVRPPGSSTGVVVLRSQTALTGSVRPRTIPAAGSRDALAAQMNPAACQAARVSCFSRQPPGVAPP